MVFFRSQCIVSKRTTHKVKSQIKLNTKLKKVGNNELEKDFLSL